jgi:hypothetical protein
VPDVIGDCLGGSAEDYRAAREQLTAMLERVDACPAPE